MATLKGPLFSLDASGTVGGAVVYSKWKGRNYARRHAVPANPKSVGQLSMRAMLKFLTQAWAGLSDNDKADWETRAAVTNISSFNAYVSYNMKRWGTNLYPSQLDPATETNTASTISAFSATAGVRSILVSVTLDVANDGWGILIFRDTDTGVGITRNELVQVVPAAAAATFTWLDFPLTAGDDQYYECATITDDGVIGAAEGEVNATPTAT